MPSFSIYRNGLCIYTGDGNPTDLERILILCYILFNNKSNMYITYIGRNWEGNQIQQHASLKINAGVGAKSKNGFQPTVGKSHLAP